MYTGLHHAQMTHKHAEPGKPAREMAVSLQPLLIYAALDEQLPQQRQYIGFYLQSNVYISLPPNHPIKMHPLAVYIRARRNRSLLTTPGL
jgi:hypothetical protein